MVPGRAESDLLVCWSTQIPMMKFGETSELSVVVVRDAVASEVRMEVAVGTPVMAATAIVFFFLIVLVNIKLFYSVRTIP
jgi:hypothetical protein